ncbi:hypothetical protein [Microvirga massiliensis]|uniref:hypothetical protein n=1 Tax=Microvirga massiliensis TaxID=1033741 RepID=UPI00062BDED6|nr:hypothetical protein [Microvirga massiliensis]
MSVIGALAIPIAACRLAVQIPTDLLLLTAEALALGTNPALLLKLAAIVLGLLHIAVYYLAIRDVSSSVARATAAMSLFAWVIVLGAGRMVAYL